MYIEIHSSNMGLCTILTVDCVLIFFHRAVVPVRNFHRLEWSQRGVLYSVMYGTQTRVWLSRATPLDIS